jgi:hypothetical protein
MWDKVFNKRWTTGLLAVVAVACFAVAFSVNRTLTWTSENGGTAESVYRLGLDASPWLTSTCSGNGPLQHIRWDRPKIRVNFICWSSVFLVAGILALIVCATAGARGRPSKSDAA